MPLTIDRSVCIVKGCRRRLGNGRKPPESASVTASSTRPIACSIGRACGRWVSTASWRRPMRRRRRCISTSAPRTSSWRCTSSADRGRPREHRGVPRRHAAITTRAQVFRLGPGVGGVEGLPRVPLAAYGERATDAAHPARAIAHGQRTWFMERFLEWTKAAGVKDPKATARALVVLFDGAVAGSEVDGPQRASDARRSARKLLAG